MVLILVSGSLMCQFSLFLLVLILVWGSLMSQFSLVFWVLFFFGFGLGVSDEPVFLFLVPAFGFGSL